MKREQLGAFFNYVGQLRIYSLVDMALLCAVLTHDVMRIVGVLLWWLGFLVYLEGEHRDSGRRLWPRWVAPTLFASGTALTPSLLVVPFILLCQIYAWKKRNPVLGVAAPAVNGTLKAVMLAPLALSLPECWLWLGLIWVVMTIRNLAGDFRDTVKDRAAGTTSPPVFLGVRRNIWWLYPTCLLATTVLWWTLGGFAIWWLALALAAQALTYRLTPR